MNFINKVLELILGKKSDKDIKKVMPIVQAIKEIYPELSSLTNDELRYKTVEFKEQIAEYLAEIDGDIKQLEDSTLGNPDVDPDEKAERYTQIDKLKKQRDELLEEILEEILPEAFAVVKETARRFKEEDSLTATATQLDRDLSINHEHITIEGDQVTYQTSWMAGGTMISWDMVHYDVQLVGGISLHQGKISEMATGEGKTLVATLPAYLNGLSGQGVHIVTVNNYLAQRDSEWMSAIFNFLGLTVSCIDQHQPNSPARRQAYMADIVYGTNNEFGFDYLRDNMVRNPDELVQRKQHFAMIDEVDSVLIDDARTPLIISGPVERGDEHQFDELKPRIERLINAQRKLTRSLLVQAKNQIKEGKKGEHDGGLALLRAFRGLPRNKALIKYMSESGVKTILLATENFYLQEQAKRMPEVDEELFFVIDEKNNTVDLTDKGIDLITNTGEDPKMFLMPDVGGTIAEIENSDQTEEEKRSAKDKLLQDFAIKSERLHSVQQLLKAYTLFERDVEYIVVDDKVKIVDEQTGRVMEGRRYSDGLHQAIEAKESVKVEAATQTFATITLQNFFRMYHKLAGMTGTAETEAGEFWEIYKLDVVVIPTNRPIQRDDRNDLVYRTAREKYNAVIDEVERLRNNGQPVLVGTAAVDVSELLSRMLRMRGIKHNVLNAKQHAREAEIVAHAGQAPENELGDSIGNVTIATNMAGRGTDIKLGTGVKEAGGLAIIGTERHDSRRVDRQLRGRAGRQGDPGSSQFYVSLEDNLMRKFGSDRIAKVMDKMGYEDGEVIQHNMITKSIERAQKKVEENNFGIRKRLLDYDEVMNEQRKVIYTKRRHALFGERLSVDLNNSFRELADEVVFTHKDPLVEPNYDDFKMDVLRNFAIDVSVDEEQFIDLKEDVLADMVFDQITTFYKRKASDVAKQTWPFIKRWYEEQGQTIRNIIVPFTDGTRVVNVVANLEEAYESQCQTLVRGLEKSVSLAFIDESWKEHLRHMDELKQAVQTAVYEQKDPLLIFKKEAFGLFKTMILEMSKEISNFLFKSRIYVDESAKAREAQQKRTNTSKYKTSRESDLDEGQQTQTNSSQPQNKQPIRRESRKVGRNEPCPCGSGKKYKHCHGKVRQA